MFLSCSSSVPKLGKPKVLMTDVVGVKERKIMPIEIKGRESIKIEDGKHTGKIEKIEQRDVKDYTLIFNEVEIS